VSAPETRGWFRALADSSYYAIEDYTIKESLNEEFPFATFSEHSGKRSRKVSPSVTLI
jgi:hypothetical protein